MHVSAPDKFSFFCCIDVVQGKDTYTTFFVQLHFLFCGNELFKSNHCSSIGTSDLGTRQPDETYGSYNDYDGQTVYELHKEQVSWEDALVKCNTWTGGGRLAQITEQATFEVLADQAIL